MKKIWEIHVVLWCICVCAAEECPLGWTEFCDGQIHVGCYYVDTVDVTYQNAFSICAGMAYPSTLVNPISQAHAEFVTNLTENNNLWYDNGDNPSKCYLIGGVNQTILEADCQSHGRTVCDITYSNTTAPIPCYSPTAESIPPSTEITTTSTAAETSTTSTAAETSTTSTAAETSPEISTQGQTSTTADPETTSSQLNESNVTTSPANGSNVTCLCTEVCYVSYSSNDLQAKVKDIKQNLTVDTTVLSATVRRLTCAEDNRPSSAYIGYTGGIILVLLVLVIVSLDCFPKAHKYPHHKQV